MAGIMDFLKDELAKTKRSFGLLGELKAKNDPKVKELDEFERKLYEKSLIYKSMKDAFTAPMRAYTGEIDALGDPRSAMEEAMNTAGMAQLGGIPGGARGPGSVGMVRGGKIAELLDPIHGSKVDAWLSENDKVLNLSKLVANERDQGVGTAFMRDLVAEADKTGKRVDLSPSADFGGNKKRLQEFYSRFGFVPNKGRTKDLEISESMYRLPAAPMRHRNALGQEIPINARVEELYLAGKRMRDDVGSDLWEKTVNKVPGKYPGGNTFTKSELNNHLFGTDYYNEAFNGIVDVVNPTDYHAFQLGFNGYPLKPVRGWRYGDIPESGVSRNFREETAENGVSMMALDDMPDPSPASKVYEMLNSQGKKKVRVEGYFNGYGSDGEPLVIGARVIDDARRPRNALGKLPYTTDVAPPVEGMKRLYRAESPTTKFDDVFNREGLPEFATDKTGTRFTDDLKYADYFRKSYGPDAQLSYVDVPIELAEKGRLNGYEFRIDSPSGRPRNALNQEIPPTQYELAHAEAQRVAAFPVDQGGLGLHPGNTAMERARAMGFDTDAYHGGTNDFASFNANRPVYATDEPRIADIYANATGRHAALREINASPNVMPLKLGGKKLEVSDLGETGHGWYSDNLASALGVEPQRKLLNTLPDHGYDRLEVTDFSDLGGDQMQHMLPAGSNVIRSRFAAFNPAKRDSSDLLAGLGMPVTTSALLAALLAKPDEAQAK